MLIACWSVKGGSGTTVVSAALALLLARAHTVGACIADLDGDVAGALGVVEPAGPGLGEWLNAGPDAPAAAIERMATPVVPGLSLLHRGAAVAPDPAAGERLAAALAGPRPVVVDCGSRCDADGTGAAVAAAADLSLLVLRPCFLGLRRAVAAPLRPSAVVLVAEEGRALAAADVEDALGVPVRAQVPVSAAVARAVDAGLLARRLPRDLHRSLNRGFGRAA